MRFLRAVSWEFIQNLPPISAFVTAVWLWKQRRKKEALACVVIGSAAGALLIRFTEATINSILEPARVTIVNFVVFSLGMLLFTAYLGTDEQSKWSNWKTDMVLGWGMGILIGGSQALSAGGWPLIGVIVHLLAMALPIPLVLISVRVLLKNVTTLQSALTRSVILAATMTALLSVAILRK